MVPHRQTLQIIALTSLAAPNPGEHRDALCQQLSVQFPCTLNDFLAKDVYPWLTADIESLLRTTDYSLIYDYRPLFVAAKQLGVERLLCITGDGPSHNIPSSIVKWRDNKSLRVFIETCLLCEISPEQIAEDIKQMYGQTASADELRLFESLFVDKLYVFGDSWFSYLYCVGEAEAKFKQSLMGEPKDYVRWRLGVPVALDSDKVINRLVSDSYYTLRLLKGKMDDPTITPGKQLMDRMKFETDTLFKGIDRRVKLAELASAAGSVGSTDAAEEIKKIVLEFRDHKHPLKRDLPDTKPTLDQLNGTK